MASAQKASSVNLNKYLNPFRKKAKKRWNIQFSENSPNHWFATEGSACSLSFGSQTTVRILYKDV